MRCDPHPCAVAVQLSQGKITLEQLDEEQIREVVKYLHREEKWGKKQIAAFFGIRHRPLAWVRETLWTGRRFGSTRREEDGRV